MASADQILNDILSKIGADSFLTKEFVRETLRDQEYLGFNAIKILEKIMIFIKNNPSSGAQDIVKLIMLGMYRGNKVSAIMKTSSELTKIWLSKMITELDIKDKIKSERSKKTTSNADRLTLSRLRMSMPQLAYKALKFEEFHRQVNLSNLSALLPTYNKMLYVARDMCIMSLIPNFPTAKLSANHRRILISHIYLYCLAETYVLIDPDNPNSSIEDRSTRVVKYMGISYNASHVTKKMREKFSDDVTSYLDSFDSVDFSMFDSQMLAIEDFASDFGINLISLFAIH